jgi:signal peptidase I
MEPTIHAGEQAFSRQYKASENPQRGDVAVFRYPKSPKTQYCKRVVALPGETIEIRDKKLIVNGSVVNEPYVRYQDPRVFLSLPMLPEPFRSRDQLAPHILGPDQYFVLGDNRDFSSDSRYWGPVKRKLFIGKIVKAGKAGGPLREIR